MPKRQVVDAQIAHVLIHSAREESSSQQSHAAEQLFSAHGAQSERKFSSTQDQKFHAAHALPAAPELGARRFAAPLIADTHEA